MNPILNSLMKVDLSKLDPSTLKGLQDGTMQLWGSNGTVSYAPGHANAGQIVQHLSFIPMSPEELANPQQLLEMTKAIQSAQSAALAATAISTVAIIGVVVVATAYLGGKIDAVHDSVHALDRALAQSAAREDLHRITAYTGALRAAREMISGHARASSAHVAHGLATARNASLAYLAGLRARLLDKDTPPEELARTLSLSRELLDMLPTAMTVERDVSRMTGEHRLASQLAFGPLVEYRRHLSEFRQCCQELYRRLASGEGGPADVLRGHLPALQALFNSPVNEFLLAGLATSPDAEGATPDRLEALFAMMAAPQEAARAN